MTPLTPAPVPHACPGPEALAELVDGALSDARRARLEAHLVGCEACRTTVALSAQAVEAAQAPAGDVARPALRSVPGRAWARWTRVAAAALVVAAVGAGFALRGAPSDGLEAAFAELRASGGGLFADVRPLSAAELAAGDPAVFRGGIDWMTPTGTTTQDRPTFEWAEVAGADRYRVTITDAEGARVVTTTAKKATLDGGDLPSALKAGGDYVWRVTALDAPTPADGATALHVATATERAAVRELKAVIETTVRRDLVDLVMAQTLLRRGLAAEALPYARRHAQHAPDDGTGRDTLALALRRLAPTGGR